MSMKSSIAAIFAYLFVLRLGGTVAYSAALSPALRLAPTPILPIITTPTTPLAYDHADTHQELLHMQSVVGRVFRRGKSRLQTLVKKTTTKKQKDPEDEDLWRVMFHNSEAMPDRVARELTKVFPISRTTAFDLCLRARSTGTVEVVVTNKRQAEKYCGAILRRGLTATIEPYSFDRDE